MALQELSLAPLLYRVKQSLSPLVILVTYKLHTSALNIRVLKETRYIFAVVSVVLVFKKRVLQRLIKEEKELVTNKR